MPVVRTNGRAYGHVITKFSRMGRLPHFLTHGAPLRAFRARELRYKELPVSVEFTKYGNRLFRPVKRRLKCNYYIETMITNGTGWSKKLSRQ